ncbi:MAG: lipoprotein-releasing system ATP-binding protein LolD [Flavobacteriaceae bacterium]|nr:lipoprotein-releasing system ATP-binding protein LolD [Flavobacteriaceae bacterium]OUX40433.1 MAG: lipoprotein-releasing system ATP-binding protein LolD [Flavobacteriaceae bacterium TMED265]|tara:strand:+ start:2062 stop:2721 length:660 start_codon:yes stop_codon:yes gene_type:complete
MIKVSNLFKTYSSNQVLKGISLEVKQGEIVAIVGPSGAGKTTLLQILGTLDQPDGHPSTEIRINDIPVHQLKDSELADFRNKEIGFVFQFHQLLPELTAIENVMLPRFISGISKAQATEKANTILSDLGLGHRLNHHPNQLSGGEQQRVAVARALINDPSIVLADEPSGNLDSENAQFLHELFLKLRDEYNQTFVIVTHNNDLAEMVDRKLSMRDGLFQ